MFLNRWAVSVRSVLGFFIIARAFLAIRFLNLTILQNHLVNVLSTINTFPHPKMFGFMINLFVNHNATTAVAFSKPFLHPPSFWKEKVLSRSGVNNTKAESFVNTKAESIYGRRISRNTLSKRSLQTKEGITPTCLQVER